MTDLDLREVFAQVLTDEPALPPCPPEALVAAGHRQLRRRRLSHEATVAVAVAGVCAATLTVPGLFGGGRDVARLSTPTGPVQSAVPRAPATAKDYADWLRQSLPDGTAVQRTVFTPWPATGRPEGAPELRVSLILDGGGWVFLYLGSVDPFHGQPYCAAAKHMTACTVQQLADGSHRIDRHWAYPGDRLAQAVTVVHPDGHWATAHADNAIFPADSDKPGAGDGRQPPLTTETLAVLATRAAGTTLVLPTCSGTDCGADLSATQSPSSIPPPTPAVCGTWSNPAYSAIGKQITARYGDIRSCGWFGSGWYITTLGADHQPGILGIYPCRPGDAVCRDGTTDHPFAGWSWRVPPGATGGVSFVHLGNGVLYLHVGGVGYVGYHIATDSFRVGELP